MTFKAASAIICALVAVGCGASDSRPESPQLSTTTTLEPTPEPAPTGGGSGQDFPDVIGVRVEQAGESSFDFAVTISSPYDSPDRYADAWRVTGPDGTIFGIRELLHDHAAEQPFTRTLAGVEIPAEVIEVTVEGRDKANGWGGQTETVVLPGRDD